MTIALGGPIRSGTENSYENNESEESDDLHSDPTVEEQVVHEDPPDLTELRLQPSGKAGIGGVVTKYNPKRFCLQFGRESDEEIERRKLLAKTTPITSVLEVMRTPYWFGEFLFETKHRSVVPKEIL